MADSNVGRLIYKITGDLSDIKASLSNAEKQVQQFTKFIKSAAGLFGAAAAFSTFIGITKDLVGAYAESEAASAKLSNAIHSTGQEGEYSAQNIEALATSLQRTTQFEDDLTVSAAAVLTSMKLNEAQVRQLLPVLQDYAAATGTDLVSAAEQFGQYLQGGRNPFIKYGIQAEKNATQSERMTALVGGMTTAFGGMAEKLGGTTLGSVARFDNAMGDLKEMLGEGFAAGAQPAMDWFVQLVGHMKDGKKAADDMNVAVRTVVNERSADQNLLARQADILAAQTERQMLLSQTAYITNQGLRDQLRGQAAEIQKKIAEMEASLPKLEALRDRAAENAKKQQEAQQRAEDTRQKRIAGINAEIDANNKLIDSLDEQAREKARAEAEVTALVNEGEANAAEARQRYYDDIKAKADTLRADQAQAEYDTMAAVVEAGQQANKQRIANEVEAARQIRSIQQSTMDFAIGAIQGVDAINSARLNRQLAELTQEQNQELATLTAKQQQELANFTGTEQEKAALLEIFAAEKQAVEEKWAKEKSRMEYDAAMNSWRLQLALAIATGAKAVIESLASLPWPLNLIPAAMSATLAGLQIEAVRESMPIPTFAEGGHFIIPPGYPNDSFLMRGQSGEEVDIQPANRGGSGAAVLVRQPLILQIDGRPIYQGLFEATKNGIALVHGKAVR